MLVLAGEDGARARRRTRAASSASCARMPGIGNVTSTSSLVRPELIVRPDFAARRRPRRDLDGDRRDAAHRHRRRLRPGLAKLNLAQRQVPIVVKLPTERAQRPRPAVAPGGARRARAGDARQRRDAGDRQRPGADRPLRPPAQHQLRDRAERAAARRRSRTQALALPSLQQPAARRDRRPTRRRRRGDDRAVRQLRPGDADRRALHLHRAGAAVQGLRPAGRRSWPRCVLSIPGAFLALFITRHGARRCRR